MYALADKYDISSLKTRAKKGFEQQSEVASMSMERSHLTAIHKRLLDVVSYIYTHTGPHEMGLRQSIVKLWTRPAKYLKAGKKQWLELAIKYPELGADMISGLLATMEDSSDE